MSTQPGDMPVNVPIDPFLADWTSALQIDVKPYHATLIRHGYELGALGGEYQKVKIRPNGGMLRLYTNISISAEHPGHLAASIRRKELIPDRLECLAVNILWQSDDQVDPLTPELLDAALTILDAPESKGDGQPSPIQDYSDSAQLFLNEECIKEQNFITPCPYVYEAYAKWAKKNGFQPPANRTQFEDVFKALGLTIRMDGPRSYWKGIRVNDSTFS